MAVHLSSRPIIRLNEEQKLMKITSGNSYLTNNTFYQNWSYNGTAYDTYLINEFSPVYKNICCLI